MGGRAGSEPGPPLTGELAVTQQPRCTRDSLLPQLNDKGLHVEGLWRHSQMAGMEMLSPGMPSGIPFGQVTQTGIRRLSSNRARPPHILQFKRPYPRTRNQMCPLPASGPPLAFLTHETNNLATGLLWEGEGNDVKGTTGVPASFSWVLSSTGEQGRERRGRYVEEWAGGEGKNVLNCSPTPLQSCGSQMRGLACPPTLCSEPCLHRCLC